MKTEEHSSALQWGNEGSSDCCNKKSVCTSDKSNRTVQKAYCQHRCYKKTREQCEQYSCCSTWTVISTAADMSHHINFHFMHLIRLYRLGGAIYLCFFNLFQKLPTFSVCVSVLKCL